MIGKRIMTGIVIVLILTVLSSASAGCLNQKKCPSPNQWLVTTLDAESPSGPSTPEKNQLVARFNIKNLGEKDIVIKQITFSKEGSFGARSAVVKIYQNSSTLLAIGSNWTGNASQVNFTSLLMVVPKKEAVSVDIKIDTSGVLPADTFRVILDNITWIDTIRETPQHYEIFNIPGGMLTY